MTAMKQQKSNEGILGLFSLGPCYTLSPVDIDKSRPTLSSHSVKFTESIRRFFTDRPVLCFYRSVL
jgi:hypothetical protein